MPTHLINPDFFIINYKPEKKISSLMTVFTMWNTMVGSSLLTLPWAFAHAGMLIAFLIAMISGLSSMYTCLLIVKNAKRTELDFGDTAERFYGSKGRICNLMSSVLLMLGATLGYYELLTQSLYPCIQGVINLIKHDTNPTDIHNISLSSFSLTYVCLGMSVILFIIFLKRDISCFIILNSFGVLFVLMIIFFNIGYAVYGFSNTSYSFKESRAPQSPNTIALYNLDFGKLAGILGSGFLIHNFILVLLDKTANPENKARDVKCGFFFVFLSYLIVGMLGYFGFNGSYFNDFPALYKTQVSLNIFPSTHPIAFCVRLCYSFQIISVFPLLFSITRTQFLALIGIDQRTATRSFWLFNVVIIIAISIVGIVYPNVGSIMAYVGALCGFVLIYFVPILVQLKARHRQTSKEEISILITDPDMSEITSPEDSSKFKRERGVGYWLGVVGNIAILCSGVAVIALQFVKLE